MPAESTLVHSSKTTEETLETYRNVLRSYRLEGLSVVQIRQRMIEVYGFSASPQQYDRFFIKSGFRKKRTTQDWHLVAQNVIIGKRLQPDFAEAEIDGVFIPRKKLKSSIHKYVNTSARIAMQAVCAPFGNPNASILRSAIIPASTCKIKIWPALKEPGPKKFITDTPFTSLLNMVSSLSTQHLLTLNGVELPGNLLHHLLCTAGRPIHKSKLPVPLLWKRMSSKFRTRECDSCEGCDEFLSKDNTGFTTEILERLESIIREQTPGDFRQRLSALRYGSTFQGFVTMAAYLTYVMCNDLGNIHLQERVTRLFLMPVARPFVRALMLCDTPVLQAVLRQALLVCCHVLDLELLKVLVSYGINVNMTIDVLNGEPLTPLLKCMPEDIFKLADWKDQYEFIKALLDAGADANLCSCQIKSCRNAEIQGEINASRSSAKSHYHHDCCENSPLARVVNGYAGPGVISLLIDHGAVVYECHNLCEAIDRGASLGDIQAVLRAMPALATSSQYSRSFSSALEAALAKIKDCENSDMARLLLDHGASVTQSISSSSPQSKSKSRRCTPSESACLIFALRQDDEDLPCILLAKGADANSCCRGLEADEFTHPFLFERESISLKQYANTNFKEWLEGCEGVGIYLPVQAAITSGSIHRVRIILSAGADLHCCHGTPPLALAVQTGNPKLVRLLITLGADLDATSTTSPMNGTRLSPLAEAAARNHVEIFNILLTAGADINVCDSDDGLTPLQTAILSQSRECIETLLRHREIDVWKPGATKIGIDTLVASILAKDVLLFNHFIKLASQQTIMPSLNLQNMVVAAIQVEDSYFLDSVIALGANLYHPDVAYCASTSVSRLQLLLNRGLCLDNFVDDQTFFNAVFHEAQDRGRFVFVKYLISLATRIETALVKKLCLFLEKWASIEFWRDTEEQKAHACEILKLLYQRLSRHYIQAIAGRLGMMTALLKLRFKCPHLSCAVDPLLVRLLRCGFGDLDCHCVCDRQALYWACYTEDSNFVQRLLESGISTTFPRFCSIHNKTWWPALQVSIENDDIASTSVLIAHGADVNTICEYFDRTPLEIACQRENLEIVKILLRHGAKLTSSDGIKNRSALMTAVTHANPDIVSELIAYGADVNAAPSGEYGCGTVLQEACAHAHVDIVKILIIHKADINAPAVSEGGVTALQSAAIAGNAKICQILVEQGADIAAPASPKEGFTAIDGAAANGRMEVLKYLLDNYSGDEPIEAVCKKARNVALAHWQDPIANMILNYRRPS